MIIAVCNQKGGVAKTTTAHAIATGATIRGYNSLAVDLDPQGNLSFSMRGNLKDVGTYELLYDRAKASQVIQKYEQCDIITSSQSLATLDVKLNGSDRAMLLRKGLQSVRNKYDYITIDCPPSLNILLVNALVAADVVIIPITTDMLAIQGLYQLLNTIYDAQKVNKGLTVGGVLLTKYNNRTILARDFEEIIQNTCKKQGVKLYNTRIREGVAIREAQAENMSIFEYAKNSKQAKDYASFLDELGIK